MNTSKGPYIANFDSAAAMLRALANYLHGEDFLMLGTVPKSRAPLMKLASLVGSAINALPVALREQVYIWSGRTEAIAAAIKGHPAFRRENCPESRGRMGHETLFQSTLPCHRDRLIQRCCGSPLGSAAHPLAAVEHS